MSTIFVDTNCWVYATNPKSPFHVAALHKLNEFQTQGYSVCSCPQVIKEYVRVLTSEGIFTHSEINQKAAFIRQNTLFMPETTDTVALFENLISQHTVKGKPVYDCNIVAVMLHYDIPTILTNNTSDFSPRYDHLIQTIGLF